MLQRQRVVLVVPGRLLAQQQNIAVRQRIVHDGRVLYAEPDLYVRRRVFGNDVRNFGIEDGLQPAVPRLHIAGVLGSSLPRVHLRRLLCNRVQHFGHACPLQRALCRRDVAGVLGCRLSGLRILRRVLGDGVRHVRLDVGLQSAVHGRNDAGV
jgi:hypothetical protein